MPDLVLKVGSMHNTVKGLLVKAVRIYKGDEELLQRNTRSTLAELYRTHWKQGTNNSLVQASSNNVLDSRLPSGSCVGSRRMDVLAEAAWHHDRLQDVLGPRVSELEIGPTADVVGAQNGDAQDPAVQASTTQETHRMKHQMHGQNLVPATDAAIRRQNLHDGNNVQPEFWLGMDSRGPYAAVPQDTALLHSASTYPFAQPCQAGMNTGTYTTSMAPDADDSWLDDYYPSMFNDLIQPYSMSEI